VASANPAASNPHSPGRSVSHVSFGVVRLAGSLHISNVPHHRQSDVEKTLHEIKRVEERIAEEHARIVRLARRGQPIENAKAMLGILMRFKELLREHLASMTDPKQPGNLDEG